MTRFRARAGTWAFNWHTLIFAVVCAGLALAVVDPAIRVDRPVFRYVFVLDVTQSMNTRDYLLSGRALSRLEFAKRALRTAFAELPCGSQAGLAIFTEYRSVLLFEPIEVCAHYKELLGTLERMDWRMAWAGASEVTKGVYFGIRMVKSLPSAPALVFITDGHEAPPLHPQLALQVESEAGEVKGLIVGAGGLALSPIPKHDMAGNPIGYWEADEVLQTDRSSLGRSSSQAGERMVLDEDAPEQVGRSGTEHLSSLREPHLRELAHKLKLSYHRLESASEFASALRSPEFALDLEVETGLGAIFAAASLFGLILAYAVGPTAARAAAIRRT